jgi:hypothetical protein
VTTYHVLSIILSALTLLALLKYVYDTQRIAKASVEQNEILTRPAVTATVRTADMIREDGTRVRPDVLEDMPVHVKNHTAIHAQARIKINCTLHRSGDLAESDHSPAAGCYSGTELWGLPAFFDMTGHTSLPDLSCTNVSEGDEITIVISVESRVFPEKDGEKEGAWLRNPPVHYRYRHDKRLWIPYPAGVGGASRT